MSNPPSRTVLPIPGERNILITSALPYVNNVPHLGNLIGCVLSADVYARYCRLKGYNAIYICGTDEYGTATETKALKEGVTPKQICDKYFEIHKQIYEWFNISFDKFGRTSTDYQTEIAQDIFLKLHKNGYTLNEDIEQLYCDTCKMFLADRFVEGTCPLCQYEDARGDQCDKCTKLLNPTDLIKPRCSVCTHAPQVKTTRHVFLDLPQLHSKLNDFVAEKSVEGKWSENSTQITNHWLKGELKPRCITRDLKWGTPVPLEEFSNKVFYVWFDAPIGYLSITKDYTSEWEQWWKNSKDVKLIQFMGKDNVPFHTVIFPASLIGSEDPYTLLHHISTTEFLNYETGKFSKSRNTGVFGDGAKDTGIPSEIWRFYLLINRPEQSDSVFSWDDFNSKNLELLNNFGNLVNRVLKIINSTFGGVIPKHELIESDNEFIAQINTHLVQYFERLENINLKEGLKIAMAISKLGNAYMQDNKPWDQTDNLRCGTILVVLVNTIKLLATIFEPYVPTLSDKIHKQLNVEPTKYSEKFEFLIKEGHTISKEIVPLIKKIEDEHLKKLRTKFSGVSKEEFPLDLKVATVKEVNDHPTSDTLYVIKAHLGGDVNKTIVAGLKSAYTKEDLINKKIVVLGNLKPSKFRGVLSEAMIVVGDDGTGPSGISVLVPSKPANEGTSVCAKGMTVKPKANIDYQKEFLHYDLKVENGVLTYNKAPLLIGDDNVTLDRSNVQNGKIR
eukprot:gene8020-9865_t